jgi:hypothetical protein
MKSVRLFILAPFLLFFAVFSVQNASASSTFTPQFEWPTQGGQYVSEWTTIIIRPGVPIDASSLDANLFSVTGSISGVHAGTVILAEDGLTVIFKPGQAFANGELVYMRLNSGIRTLTGATLGSHNLMFQVSKTSHPALVDEGVNAQNSVQVSNSLPLLAPDSASTLPAFVMNTKATGDVAPGALFLANFSENAAVLTQQNLIIMNNDASTIWSRAMPQNCVDFKLQPTGLLTYFQFYPGQFQGRVYGMDSSYNVVDSFYCHGYGTTGTCEVLPHQRALVFDYDTESFDFSKHTVGGDANGRIINIIVQEIDSLKNVLFQWSALDHFTDTDAIGVTLTTPVVDVFHANSLVLDSDGTFLLSCRYLSEVTKIDPKTGNVVWHLGGKHNSFTLVGDSIWFTWQHDPKRIASGNITLLDNGNLHTPKPFSRILEYKLDETLMTCTKVWEYRDSLNGNVVATPAMGSVQRLPNGNTLIGWGLNPSPAVTEVKPDGTKVFEMSFTAPNVSFRAFRFPWAGANSAVATNVAAHEFSLSQNYPNPFGGASQLTTIAYSLEKSTHVKLALFDVAGREVQQLVNEDLTPGNYKTTFTAGQLPSGVYEYRLDAGGVTQARTMLLVR